MSKEGPLEVWGVQNVRTPCKRVKNAGRGRGEGGLPCSDIKKHYSVECG